MLRWTILAALGSVYLLSDAPSVLWPKRGFPCLPDDEGSWSIGIFRGPSPLNLTPIEGVYPRTDVDEAAAWPVANPVLTCASVTDFPSNFVADPFLFAKNGPPNKLGSIGRPLHMFFETKSNGVMRGEIGVAESLNGGATWRHLGIVLRESWHLSYPHVFSWNGEVYMLPEGSGSGGLRLYRAVEYPLRWELTQEIIKRPLIDASILEWKGRWYIFASDPSRPGHKKNAELQIFHAESPLGPWSNHFLNPVMYGDARAGARMAGRLLIHNSRLYRFGQDCSGTYGRNIVAYRIDTLSPTEFDQTRIKFNGRRTEQGPGAWNGVRRHHLDALQLGDGSWLAVMDGDWQESNPLSKPFVRRAIAVGLAWAAAVVVFGLALADRTFGRSHLRSSSTLPLRNTGSWRRGPLSKSQTLLSGLLPAPVQKNITKQVRWVTEGGCSEALTPKFGQSVLTNIGWRPSKGTVLLTLAMIILSTVFLAVSMGAWYYLSLVRETPTATAAVAIDGVYSRLTVMVMSFSLREDTLRSLVEHYARCPSVAQVLVVWNERYPPEEVISTSVPVRIRYEKNSSLNNRFRPDPLIPTRAVLSLDYGVLMRCRDIEAGFAEWRRHPEDIVGYHPRLLSASPAVYRSEWETLAAKKYNAMLTGATFIDADRWFTKYWDEEYAPVREIVDEKSNCEDILMNFIVAANAKNKTGHPPVRFVRPHRRLDISAGSNEGPGVRTLVREDCINEFTKHFGHFPLRVAEIKPTPGASRKGPWCWMPGVSCVYV